VYSKAKLGGHPIHPMLVAFPIAFYAAAFIGFIVYQSNHDAFWFRLAYYFGVAGVVTALLAAIPGFIDWGVGIPTSSAAKRRGLTHASLNVGALLLFGITAIVFRNQIGNPPDSVGLAIVLTGIGFILTMAAGYHGWELIARHKVGVDLTPEQERLEPDKSMQPRGTEVPVGRHQPSHA